MQPAHVILLAADFSAESVGAFRVACSIAIERGTRMVVLHVVDPDREEAGSSPEAEARRAALNRQLGEVYVPDRLLDVDYCVRVGIPPIEILRTAAEVEAGLIAMGTHGRTGLRRLLAGSVAIDVLRDARCSVLALRDHRGSRPSLEIRVILHPTDFSKASEASLVMARSLARDLGARLVVLHVIPVDPYLDGRLAAAVDSRDYQRSLNSIRERLDGAHLKHPVETCLTRGVVAEEILRVAGDLACDLIVMGTHGRTGVGRLLIGSVGEFVLPRADCAVFIAKPPELEPVPGEGLDTTEAATVA
jgi:nucleotide-binding universal stress UspA family protein